MSDTLQDRIADAAALFQKSLEQMDLTKVSIFYAYHEDDTITTGYAVGDHLEAQDAAYQLMCITSTVYEQSQHE